MDQRVRGEGRRQGERGRGRGEEKEAGKRSPASNLRVYESPGWASGKSLAKDSVSHHVGVKTPFSPTTEETAALGVGGRRGMGRLALLASTPPRQTVMRAFAPIHARTVALKVQDVEVQVHELVRARKLFGEGGKRRGVHSSLPLHALRAWVVGAAAHARTLAALAGSKMKACASFIPAFMASSVSTGKVVKSVNLPDLTPVVRGRVE